MQSPLTINSKSPDETTKLAGLVCASLMPGDVLLLSGHVGAGKTHFARSIIQNHLPNEDVPSPTFTLVQTYETDDAEIWHVDLYRLSSPAELEELGLNEALDAAICLIEWPDRMGLNQPEDALKINLEISDHLEARVLTFEWTDAKWAPKLDGLLHD